MKTKNILLLFLSIVLIESCAVKKAGKLTSDSKVLRFQTIVDSIYNVHPDAIGLMVHIESPEQKISWSGAAGYSDFKTKTTIENDQPALIASSIKTYIAATILRLVEDGKLRIDQPIENLITSASKKLLSEDGYDLATIQVKHLLSHTSSIEDYVCAKHVEKYFKFIDENKKYRWTRDEQIALTVERGDPLGKAEDVFNYADANYLLLTEIIEQVTGEVFYTAIRTLLRYEELGLDATWFYTLEEKPKNVKPLAHQYYGKYNWDSYEIDPSFDLYGGGGIACTTEDLAQFSYHFFNGAIVKDKAVKDLIFTKVKTKEEQQNKYYLGLSESEIEGLTAYGHGGFWGTVVQYIPELNTSIAVYVLERDKRILRKDILEAIVKEMKSI